MPDQTSTTTSVATSTDTTSLASMAQPMMASALWMMAIGTAISLAILFVFIWIVSKAWHLGAEK